MCNSNVHVFPVGKYIQQIISDMTLKIELQSGLHDSRLSGFRRSSRQWPGGSCRCPKVPLKAALKVPLKAARTRLRSPRQRSKHYVVSVRSQMAQEPQTCQCLRPDLPRDRRHGATIWTALHNIRRHSGSDRNFRRTPALRHTFQQVHRCHRWPGHCKAVSNRPTENTDKQL